MRNHLAGAIVLGLGLLAGCSSESQTNGQATVSAARAPGAQLPALATIRASAKSFASLPDRGELLSYDNMLSVKRRGAFTDYPVSISEEHALNAMASGEMVVNTPDGGLVRLKYDRYEEYPDGNWSWIGRDENGRSAVITFGDQAVFGTIPQSNGQALRLSTLNGHAWVVSTDSTKLSKVPTNGRPEVLVPPTAAMVASGLVSGSGVSKLTAQAEAQAGPTGNIDIVIGYSQGLIDKYGSSGVGTLLNSIVALTNTAYSNSGIAMRLRPVKYLLVNYPDNSDNGTTLEKLSGYNASGPIEVDPAFKPLRDAREEFGGDIVSFVRRFEAPDNNGCGIAWMIGAHVAGDPAPGITTADAPFAYSVVSYGDDLNGGQSFYCIDESLAHETGHNLGQAHDKDNSKASDGRLIYGVHDYSFGYREATANGFHTIMAYPLADAGSVQGVIDYFANPAVKYQAKPTGVADQADNVRSMNQTMPIVAQFRATKVPITADLLDFYAVKKMGTTKTEVHALTAASNFKTFSLHLSTALAKSGTDGQWVFRFADYNGDSKYDLFAINKVGASGKTEVHILDGSKNFSTFLTHRSTLLQTTGRDNRWEFLLGDYNRDGKLDLYAIDRTGSSGKTEVHVLNGATNFTTFLTHLATSLPASGTDYRWHFKLGDYNGDKVLDLYAINKNGASGKVEMQVLSGSANFRQTLFQKAIPLAASSGSTNNWEYELGDFNRDGTLDLYAIAKVGSSGKTEVHVLSGVSDFQTFLTHLATALGSTGTDASWDFGLVPVAQPSS